MQYYNAHNILSHASRDEDTAHRGRDRRGVRAGNLRKEAVAANDMSNPRVEIPYQLTRGTLFRIVDGVEVHDRLTADDQALWHYLFARAKDDIWRLAKTGSDAGLRDREAYRGVSRVHEVLVGDLLAYLGLKNPARLRECLERITETWARYDIRYRHQRLKRPVRYMAIHEVPAKLRSRDVVRFEIDPEVRICMHLSRRYVEIDLNALPKFKSRYSVRLFTKLSVMASRHLALLNTKLNKQGQVGGNKKFWITTPEALAADLGYPLDTFRRQTFDAAVIKALAEIQGLPKRNARFDVLWVLPTTKVPRFSFAVTEARKTMFDVSCAQLSGKAFYHAAAFRRPFLRSQMNIKDSQCVTVPRIAQAQAYTGFDGLRISQAWRTDLEAANAGHVHIVAGWSTADFLARIERFGVDSVFEQWMHATAEAWNALPPVVQDAVVGIDDAVGYSNDDDDEAEDYRIGDDWGDLDYAA
ncbi:hypothetical protein Kim5_CH00798 [Rhizobium sp. Kim5]|uniref:replication initiation protein n=1 Tax=Rhizobium sp. Kim5 TaxID=2020311 RepID=UPI000A2A10F7|nr:replication initiation protein [Rhizobium sp. Kim5]ARQ56906.1 hypothetical protein Kim5_CH00798 [Rhizobium sp. Kim5]